MSVTYRPAGIKDLKPAMEVMREALNDLEIPHGFDGVSENIDTSFAEFSLATDPRGLWVAEDNNLIVGYGFSWLCGDLWFLADLFVHPKWQSKGVGRALMDKTRGQADVSGAKIQALITFSYNRASLGLYMSQGLYPRVPLYGISISRANLSSSKLKPALNYKRLDNNVDAATLGQIDRSVLGLSRAFYHRYAAGDASVSGFLLNDANGRPAGYAYISKSGHIGPLAVASADLIEPAFRTAVALAVGQGSDKISGFIPGMADDLMRIAVELRMRLGRPMVLLSSKAFGDWTRYSPRSPGYM